MVRTAQRAFEVIGQNGHDVIICLEDRCREWLDAYISADNYPDLVSAQQMLQQYSVSLAFGDYMKVHDWASRYENSILACSLEVIENNEVYDLDCGVRPIDDDSLIF